MKTKKVAIVGAILLLAIAAAFFFAQARNHRSAIETTLVWGRLAPIPQSAQGLSVLTEGSSFTRAFRIKFTASPEDVEKWLTDSPGTREAVLESLPPTTRRYSIKPGGGAQHAEVNVDDVSHTVSIYVYWS
jgi:hypothetical protein